MLAGLALLFFGGPKSVAHCGDKLLMERNIVITAVFPKLPGEDSAPLPEGEWIEISNFGLGAISLAGWVIYDSDDEHELFITSENILPKMDFPWLRPGESLTVFRDGDSDFSLDEENSSIRLFSGPLEMEGKLQSVFEYEKTTEGRTVPEVASIDSKTEKSLENSVEVGEKIQRGKGNLNKKSSASIPGSDIAYSGLEQKEEGTGERRAVDSSEKKTFIAGMGPSDAQSNFEKMKRLLGGFSFKIFLIAWSILTVAIILTRKILKG